MMKALVKLMFFALLVAVAVGVSLPNFIDWNRHRDAVAGALRKYTGQEVTIGGDVLVRVLPQPHVLLGDVKVAGGMLALKEVDARIAVEPLFRGKIEVESVSLTAPRLNLEIAEDGTENWKKLTAPQEGGGKIGDMAASISLRHVEVTDGAITYADKRTQVEKKLEGVNVILSAATLAGPYSLEGGAQYGEMPLIGRIETGVYDAAAKKIPVKAALAATETRPAVTFDGAAVLGEEASVLTGAVTMEAGLLSSLTSDPFFTFLDVPASATALLEAKQGSVTFSDIKAEFEGGGTLTGLFARQAAPDGRPAFYADLAGEKLAVTLPEGLPDGDGLSVKFKGKDITINGAKLSSLEASVETSPKEWIVKGVRAQMAGKGQITVAGVATLSSGISNMSIRVDAEDAGAMLEALPLDTQNALKVLAAPGRVGKVAWMSSFDLKPNNISMAGIDATVDGVGLGGSIDISRGTQKPAYAAKLDFGGWDAKAVNAEALSRILKSLGNADGAFDLRFKDYKDGDVTASEMTVSGRLGEEGLSLSELSASLAGGGTFTLKGTAAEVAPLVGYEFEYALRTADAAKFAAMLDAPLPPPLLSWKNVDLAGRVARGAGEQPAFTAIGTVGGQAVSYTGMPGEKGAVTADFTIARAASGSSRTGLPVEDFLAAQDKDFTMRGTVSGTRGHYAVKAFSAPYGTAQVTGEFSHKNGADNAALVMESLDFDQLPWDRWAHAGGATFGFAAKTLYWKDVQVKNATLEIAGTEDEVRLSALKGDLWDGTLEGEVTAVRQDGSWNCTFKGKVAGANLDRLREVAGFEGVKAGRGDLDIDVKWRGGRMPQDLAALTGGLGVKAGTLTVERFAPGALSGALAKLSQPMASLQQLISHALKESGGETYKGADIPVLIDGGKAAFTGVRLEGRDHVLELAGAYDLKAREYDVTGTITLTNPKGATPVRVTRAGKPGKPGDYGVDIRGMEAWAREKQDPAATLRDEGMDAVQGIMQRLDDDGSVVR